MKENWVFRSTEKNMLVVVEKFLRTQIPILRSYLWSKMNRDRRILSMFYGVYSANWEVCTQKQIAKLEECSVRTIGEVISRFRKFVDQSGKSDWKKVLNYFKAHRKIAVVLRIRFLKEHPHHC